MNNSNRNAYKEKNNMFPLRIEVRTFRVLSGCDNHYTTETDVLGIIKFEPYMIALMDRAELNFCLLVSSADNLCKQFRPRPGRQNAKPDLSRNCVTR